MKNKIWKEFSMNLYKKWPIFNWNNFNALKQPKTSLKQPKTT